MESANPPKILLVEDDKTIQKMYEVGFKGAGLSVSVAQMQRKPLIEQNK